MNLCVFASNFIVGRKIIDRMIVTLFKFVWRLIKWGKVVLFFFNMF